MIGIMARSWPSHMETADDLLGVGNFLIGKLRGFHTFNQNHEDQGQDNDCNNNRAGGHRENNLTD
jgi:hypothetical protein